MTNVQPDEPQAKPDPWAEIAAELHKLADDALSLVGQPAPSCFSISIQPVPHNVPEVVPAVDTIAMALLGISGETRAMSRDGIFHRHAEGSRGPINVAVYRQMPPPDLRDLELEQLRPRLAELEQLRARVAELEAAKAADGLECREPGCTDHFIGDPCPPAPSGVLSTIDASGLIVVRAVGPRDRRTCVDLGDQEHDHEMCRDANAEAEPKPGEEPSDADPTICYCDGAGRHIRGVNCIDTPTPPSAG